MSEYRVICAFDRVEWEKHFGSEVINLLGGDIRVVFDHALNILPWLGYGDVCMGREKVEDVLLNCNTQVDKQFEKKVDKCFHAIWELVSFIQQNIGNPRIPDEYVTGGSLEHLSDQDIAFKLYFDGT